MCRGTALSVATVPSTAASPMSLPRTSLFSAAPCPRPMPKRSARSWTLQSRTERRLIGLNDGGGARIQEGVASLGGYADIFLRNTLASGVVPQISAIMGPCAGGAVYSPAITDFIFMVAETSYMFVTGPDVIKTVTHEEVSMEELGGAATHAAKSGVSHFTLANDAACIAAIRDLLSYLPSNNLEDPPLRDTEDDPDREDESLDTLIPEDPNRPYDITDLIHSVVDDGRFLQIQKDYARNLVVGFGTFAGRSVGIVANQPGYLAGGSRYLRLTQGRPFCSFLRRFQTFRSLPSKTYPASYQGPNRSSVESSSTGPSSSMPSRKRQFPRSL